MPEEHTYVVSASHPDGSPYVDQVDQALRHDGPSTAAAYGDADRDARVAAIEAAGLTPHVRTA